MLYIIYIYTYIYICGYRFCGCFRRGLEFSILTFHQLRQRLASCGCDLALIEVFWCVQLLECVYVSYANLHTCGAAKGGVRRYGAVVGWLLAWLIDARAGTLYTIMIRIPLLYVRGMVRLEQALYAWPDDCKCHNNTRTALVHHTDWYPPCGVFVDTHHWRVSSYWRANTRVSYR